MVFKEEDVGADGVQEGVDWNSDTSVLGGEGGKKEGGEKGGGFNQYMGRRGGGSYSSPVGTARDTIAL